jgi:hypothetical protein
MRKLCFLVVMERYAYRCLLKKKGVGYTGKVYVGFLQRKGSRKKGKPAFLFLFCTEYKSLLGFWYLGGFNSYFFTGFSDIYIFFITSTYTIHTFFPKSNLIRFLLGFDPSILSTHNFFTHNLNMFPFLGVQLK